MVDGRRRAERSVVMIYMLLKVIIVEVGAKTSHLFRLFLTIRRRIQWPIPAIET